MKEILNEKPFQHLSRFGTEFKCTRCDFRAPVLYTVLSNDIPNQNLMSDVAEMIAFHAMDIWPNLNGFSGYDCITFTEA